MWWKMDLFPQPWRLRSISVHVNLSKLSFKKSVRPQSNVVCLVGFWRCDLLKVCSKRTCSPCGPSFSTTGTSSRNFEMEIPSIINRNRVVLQRNNARPHEQPWQKFRNGEDLNCTTPSIHCFCAFRLPSVSIPGPFLTWKKFRKHRSCGSGVSPNSSLQKPETGAVEG